MRVTPNQVTIFRFLVFTTLSTAFFSLGSYASTLFGLFFYHLFKFFDNVDGILAVNYNMKTPIGEWLDYMVDKVATSLTIIGTFLGVLSSRSLSLFGLKHLVLPESLVITVGLTALFSQLMCELLTKELQERFQLLPFDATWKRAVQLRQKVKLSRNDQLVQNILISPTFPWYFTFGYLGLITVGGLLNMMFVALLIIAIAQTIRALTFVVVFRQAFRNKHEPPIIRLMRRAGSETGDVQT